MNQKRVKLRDVVIGAGVVLFCGMNIGTFKHAGGMGNLAMVAIMAIIGIVTLRNIYRAANAWAWNVTPHSLEKIPKGTWDIAAISVNLGESGGFVYVTTTERPMDSDFTTRMALSTLMLQRQFIDIKDYKSILDGRRPTKISVGPKSIEFIWPEKPRGHFVC